MQKIVALWPHIQFWLSHLMIFMCKSDYSSHFAKTVVVSTSEWSCAGENLRRGGEGRGREDVEREGREKWKMADKAWLAMFAWSSSRKMRHSPEDVKKEGRGGGGRGERGQEVKREGGKGAEESEAWRNDWRLILLGGHHRITGAFLLLSSPPLKDCSLSAKANHSKTRLYKGLQFGLKPACAC